MKQVTTPIFLFLVSLLLVACAPGAADAPEEAAAPEEGAPSESESVSEPATATAVATATDEAGPAGAAASPTAEDVTATEQPPPATEAAPTEPPPFPTEASAESGGEVVVNGRTPEGAYFLGRADAPVTIIDYSDFM